MKTIDDTAKSIDNFQDVQTFLSKIPNINCGGCGVAVLAMYRWLEKNGQLRNAKIIFTYEKDCCYSRYRSNQKALLKHTAPSKTPHHCGIWYNKKFVDSKGFSNKIDYPLFHIIPKQDYLRDVVNNKDGWNSDFDREDIIEIAQALDISLSDVAI